MARKMGGVGRVRAVVKMHDGRDDGDPDGNRADRRAAKRSRKRRQMAPVDPFRCICDPDDLFDPPAPMPRAVKDCPAHRARYAAQNWQEGGQ